MELFSFFEADTPLLLSASESGLFVHPVHNERFGRPVLLCSNYRSGLSGCIYNSSLYYAYINKENSLLLRRLHESTLLFRLDSTDTVTYRTPQLVPIGNTLFLFYFEEEHGSYRLKLRLPFSDIEPPLPELLKTSFRELPSLSLHATKQYLYLFFTVGATSVSYRYSPTASFEYLRSEEEYISELRTPWEAEKKQLEQGLMQAIHLSEQQQNLLTEKEQKIQLTEAKLSELTAETEQTNALLVETSSALQTAKVQLTECERNKQQAIRELDHTSHLLERAKAQYNELMQIAEQYRQEAVKWYGKFTDRH